MLYFSRKFRKQKKEINFLYKFTWKRPELSKYLIVGVSNFFFHLVNVFDWFQNLKKEGGIYSQIVGYDHGLLEGNCFVQVLEGSFRFQNKCVEIGHIVHGQKL